MKTRIETDWLGSREIPPDAPWGIHTLRALENFRFGGLRVPEPLLRALVQVKKAACATNRELGLLPEPVGRALDRACDELLADLPLQAFPLDAVQGGAGTSTHMNVNEVLAGRADAILKASGEPAPEVHPIEHANLHQSTNDVYPTAVRIAAIGLVRDTADRLASLQRAFQGREQAFADVVKLGRTECQDAAPITLGAEFSAFAEAFARDRWRMAKCEERLRTVNLGGTAVGTGLAAPRRYVFRVVDALREITGLGLARSDSLLDGSANADPFAEVAGIVGAGAVNLIKVSQDLRRLHMLGEIRLPAVQAGSSIMPGKINPVIPEAVISAALRIQAEADLVTRAASMGTLQINEFLPAIAYSLLTALDLFGRAADALARHAAGIEADAAACARRLEESPSQIVALVQQAGYRDAEALAREYAAARNGGLRAFLAERLGSRAVDRALDPRALLALGRPEANGP